MAVQNMYLTCTAHGVGCYWGTPGFMFQMKDFLQLEENERCYGFFLYGNEEVEVIIQNEHRSKKGLPF